MHHVVKIGFISFHSTIFQIKQLVYMFKRSRCAANDNQFMRSKDIHLTTEIIAEFQSSMATLSRECLRFAGFRFPCNLIGRKIFKDKKLTIFYYSTFVNSKYDAIRWLRHITHLSPPDQLIWRGLIGSNQVSVMDP